MVGTIHTNDVCEPSKGSLSVSSLPSMGSSQSPSNYSEAVSSTAR